MNKHEIKSFIRQACNEMGIDNYSAMICIGSYKPTTTIEMKKSTSNAIITFYFDTDMPCNYHNMSAVTGCYKPSVCERIGSVYVKTINRDNDDVKATIRHELRHFWQFMNGWKFDDTAPYLERKHEIDAFRWAELYGYSVKTLKSIAKDKKLKGFSKMTKKQLINLIIAK